MGNCGFRPSFESRRLVAVTAADGNAFAACGAAAAEHGCAAFGLHAGAETVGLHAAVAVGLKCTLGHGDELLILFKNLCLVGKF
jgi:hypothetical protein